MKNLRTIVLTSIFGLLLLGYLVFFVLGGEPEPLRITYRLYEPRGQFDPEHPVYGVRFEFDRPYVLRRLEVVEVEEAETAAGVEAASASAAPEQAPEPEPEPEPAAEQEPFEDRAFVLSDTDLMGLADPAAVEEPGGPMWRIVPGGESDRQGERMLRYGQDVQGMVAEPDRPAKQLQPGKPYRLVVRDADGRTGELVFQTRFFREPMSREDFLRERLEARRKQRALQRQQQPQGPGSPAR